MLVVDASVVLAASSVPHGFDVFEGHDLVAPWLLWSQARSVLHETVWRGEVSRAQADRTLEALEEAPVRPLTHDQLGKTAWKVAEEIGWAKTYDAEYIALARLLGSRLVTIDRKLRRSADRLGCVLSLDEL